MFKKVAFIGAGSVVEAMLNGILKKQFLTPSEVWVTNRSNRERLSKIKKEFGVNISSDYAELLTNADLIILSMKPKDITEALVSIKPYINQSQLIVSVLAGVSTGYIADQLDIPIPVVRAMPNTSATIGLSATAVAGGEHTNGKHLERVAELFRNIGTVVTVEEEQLHAITGLVGSGPAYIYYVTEAMEKAAEAIGLESDMAKELILQVLTGASEMLKITKATPAVLRKKITSPGGTTEAGIEELEKHHFQEAMIEAISEATNRSKDLGKPYQVSIID